MPSGTTILLKHTMITPITILITSRLVAPISTNSKETKTLTTPINLAVQIIRLLMKMVLEGVVSIRRNGRVLTILVSLMLTIILMQGMIIMSLVIELLHPGRQKQKKITEMSMRISFSLDTVRVIIS